MLMFFCGILILVAGYFVYGRIVERVVGIDDRPTPAVVNPDGVDYVVLPQWKNMLIQLLNIAGVGPVIGVILGIKFGSIVFLIIPIGNIIGGAVHDFIAGMMSLRNNGANLPLLIKITLGQKIYWLFSGFMCVLLLLVVAVFINIPAQLIDSLTSASCFWYAVAAIFIYYIAATLFPVDKIIGAIYPFFGGLLIVGSLAIFIMLMICGFQEPSLLQESAVFQAGMFKAPQVPVIPMLFVTIACGILSGFHATQSPIIARTMKSERQARASFYGMMVLEGIIAMIWAGAALVCFNLFPEWMGKVPAVALSDITTYFLSSVGGAIAVGSVIVLAITSGDTAMRSLRLSLAEIFKVDQKPFVSRIAVCVPVIIIVCFLLFWSNKDAASFTVLWNYFAWGNQVLGAMTLIAGSVWLFRRKRFGWITLLPGMFMCFIVACYILWISPDKGKGAGSAIGFGLDLNTAMIIAAAFAVIVGAAALIAGRKKQSWFSVSDGE